MASRLGQVMIITPLSVNKFMQVLKIKSSCMIRAYNTFLLVYISFSRTVNCANNKYFSEMDLTSQIAKHFKDVHFGGNWTSVNLKETLSDVDWQQATTKVYSFNTIAALVYHINYYVSVVTKALK